MQDLTKRSLKKAAELEVILQEIDALEIDATTPTWNNEIIRKDPPTDLIQDVMDEEMTYSEKDLREALEKRYKEYDNGQRLDNYVKDQKSPNNLFYLDYTLSPNEMRQRIAILDRLYQLHKGSSVREKAIIEELVKNKFGIEQIPPPVQHQIASISNHRGTTHSEGAENKNSIYVDQNLEAKVIKETKGRHDFDFTSLLKLMRNMHQIALDLNKGIIIETEDKEQAIVRIQTVFDDQVVHLDHEGNYKRMIRQKFAPGFTIKQINTPESEDRKDDENTLSNEEKTKLDKIRNNPKFNAAWSAFLQEIESTRTNGYVMDISDSSAGGGPSRGKVFNTGNVFLDIVKNEKGQDEYVFSIIDPDVFDTKKGEDKFFPAEHFRKKGLVKGMVSGIFTFIANVARKYWVEPWQKYYTNQEIEENPVKIIEPTLEEILNYKPKSVGADAIQINTALKNLIYNSLPEGYYEILESLDMIKELEMYVIDVKYTSEKLDKVLYEKISRLSASEKDALPSLFNGFVIGISLNKLKYDIEDIKRDPNYTVEDIWNYFLSGGVKSEIEPKKPESNPLLDAYEKGFYVEEVKDGPTEGTIDIDDDLFDELWEDSWKDFDTEPEPRVTELGNVERVNFFRDNEIIMPNEGTDYALTIEELQKIERGLGPVTEIIFGNGVFYLSNPIKSQEGRIGYVLYYRDVDDPKNRFSARMVYKSRSNAPWRTISHYNEKDHRFGKGLDLYGSDYEYQGEVEESVTYPHALQIIFDEKFADGEFKGKTRTVSPKIFYSTLMDKLSLYRPSSLPEEEQERPDPEFERENYRFNDIGEFTSTDYPVEYEFRFLFGPDFSTAKRFDSWNVLKGKYTDAYQVTSENGLVSYLYYYDSSDDTLSLGSVQPARVYLNLNSYGVNRVQISPNSLYKLDFELTQPAISYSQEIHESLHVGRIIDANGKKTEYYDSYRIKSEAYFKNGNPTGIWFWYDEEKNITRKKSYIQR